MSKKKNEEIKVISESPNRRPYASKIAMILGEGLEFGFDGEACLLTEEKCIVRISPDKEKAKRDGKKLQKLNATIEGFATAGQAEQMGLKLSLALLWSAVSRKWPLKLDYHTPQPCMVYDRTQNRGGFHIVASGSLHLRDDPKTVAELINQILSKEIDVDPNLLISMELFTSARLESTERTRFIGLISSLEPLASQELYNNQEIDNLVDKFIDQLSNITSINEYIKNSIVGRARMLCNESISQSIAKLVKNYIPDNPKVVESVAEAYKIRSNILHHGTYDTDLDEKSNELEDIIRYIYSKILELPLLVAPTNFERLL
jgi:hypothetical protein